MRMIVLVSLALVGMSLELVLPQLAGPDAPVKQMLEAYRRLLPLLRADAAYAEVPFDGAAELLAALAKNFIESHFDLKNLVRTICRSQVYQLSSLPNKFNAVDKQYFSRYYPKRLTAEVLLDAVDEATRSDSKFEGLPAGTRAVQLPDNSFNASSYFLAVFGRPDSSSSCECERS